MNRGVNTAYIKLQQLFRKYFRYARMISLKFSKFNFTATVYSIYAQFAPVKRGLNSAFIRLQQLFRKYFRYARMTSLKFKKFNFFAAISNIYAQFVPVRRGLYSAYFSYKQLFESTSSMREWRHWKLKYNFSAAIGNIYAHVAPMNRGLNWAYFMFKNHFRKFFRYAQMTSFIYWTKKERYHFGDVTFLSSRWKWIYGIWNIVNSHIPHRVM